MGAAIETYRYYPVTLARWDVSITIAREGDVMYFPVRPLCRAFGISSQMQIARLKSEARYREALRDIPIPSAGGAQETTCLRRRETAIWIGTIDASRCRLSARGPLEQFQQELMDIADRLLFGDLSGVLRDGLVPVRRPIYGEVYADCPRCGAPLCLVIDETGAHLVVGSEPRGD